MNSIKKADIPIYIIFRLKINEASKLIYCILAVRTISASTREADFCKKKTNFEVVDHFKDLGW